MFEWSTQCMKLTIHKLFFSRHEKCFTFFSFSFYILNHKKKIVSFLKIFLLFTYLCPNNCYMSISFCFKTLIKTHKCSFSICIIVTYDVRKGNNQRTKSNEQRTKSSASARIKAQFSWMQIANVRALSQFRRKRESQNLKWWFFFKSRPIHFHINNARVIRPIKGNKLSFSSIENQQTSSCFNLQCLKSQIQIQKPTLIFGVNQMTDHT